MYYTHNFLVKILIVVLLVSALFLLGGCDGKDSDGTKPATEPTPEATTEDTTLTDTQAPVISGVKDQIHYQNETIDFLAGVTVMDNMDANPMIKVDSSAISQGLAGVYTVVYTATDAAGNSAIELATFTILTWKDGYKTIDEVNAEADKLLKVIVKDTMTDREKVVAIYKWARLYLGYDSNFDNTQYDLYQGAMFMMKNFHADCYGYWAVTKLMFDRLGIPNIDVRKVKPYPEANNHYWSLVSVDGGKTYYHFDSTPRVGGFDGCLLTDAQLDAYSQAHKLSHNRDTSLYPATPKS